MPPCWVDWHAWCCQTAIKEWKKGFEAELREMIVGDKRLLHGKLPSEVIKEILGE